MLNETLTFPDAEGKQIFVYHWRPQGTSPPKAVVQIAHGMAEHAGRYGRFARALVGAGYEVYAHDHPGHGRTAGALDRIGITDRNCFVQMTEVMGQLTDLIRGRHTGTPLLLFGHSMGSFLAQRYMYRFASKADGFILSGTNGKQPPSLLAGIALARLLASVKGDEHRSGLLMRLTFGGYNKAFRPNRTEADWLSRDEAEVDRYRVDPYCGGVFSAGFFQGFFIGLRELNRPADIERIPKQTPVFIFAGDQDPVGDQGRGILRLVDMYRRLGLERVAYKLYPGGRHEMLNETNRGEVTSDVIAWLDKVTERKI